MFKQAGNFKGKVIETMIAEPKFSKDPNALDVCLKVEGPDGQNDWWRGEMSLKYGTGNFAGKTQAQITINDLVKIGFIGQDFTTLNDQFVGKEIDYTVVERTYEGKSYYDVKYIGGNSFAPKGLAPDAIAQRMAAMGFAAPAPAAAVAPAPVAAPTPVAGAWPSA